jgi:tRNA (cmo5U34)-methyltransferase
MDVRHHEAHRGHDGHAEVRGHADDHDWSDEAFVADWIERQEAHASERRPLFAKVRALIPKGPGEPFRYADLGAGAGHLDELILDRFAAAQGVLVDGSEPMLTHAKDRLARFAGRTQYVQSDLSDSVWAERARGPFDVVVAARAVHHVGSAERIRAFFREVLGSLAPGGLFINLDYVRLADPTFQQLGNWAREDPDAQFQITVPHMELPASVEDQLGWLREAGFAAAECVYREFQTVVVVGIKDQIRGHEGASHG